jgi:hypothetical protein
MYNHVSPLTTRKMHVKHLMHKYLNNCTFCNEGVSSRHCAATGWKLRPWALRLQEWTAGSCCERGVWLAFVWAMICVLWNANGFCTNLASVRGRLSSRMHCQLHPTMTRAQ